MYDPTIDAYREVPVSMAQKFIDEVPALQEKIEAVKVEQAKDEAYNNSLKAKKVK
jgi:hypothetical protein